MNYAIIYHKIILQLNIFIRTSNIISKLVRTLYTNGDHLYYIHFQRSLHNAQIKMIAIVMVSLREFLNIKFDS